MPDSRGQKGRQVLKRCLQLLKHHKRLFVFPLLGHLCKFLIYIAIITPFIHSYEQQPTATSLSASQSVLIFAVFLLMLFFVNLVLFFFNTALISNLIHFLRFGREASLRLGFYEACRNYPRIFAWALYTCTIGIVVNFLPRNSQYKLRLENLLRKNHWNTASYFCVPLVMDQRLWPHSALKRSSDMVGTLWGENLRRNYNMGTTLLLYEIPVVIGFIFACIYGTHMTILAVGIAAGFILLLSTSFFQMINATLRSVCYCFGAYQIIADGFSDTLIQRLFVTRQ